MNDKKEYPYIVKNNAGGVNLMVERDSGNPVLILTGKPTYSKVFWEKLRILTKEALIEMEGTHEN